MAGVACISSLPTELLAHIFEHIAGPAPSSWRLHDPPSADILSNPDPQQQPLKTASLVSRRWRSVVIPILFRHVVWMFDRWDLLELEGRFAERLAGGSSEAVASSAGKSDKGNSLAVFEFLQANGLERSVHSLTLIVSDSMAGLYRLHRTAPNIDHSAFHHAANNLHNAAMSRGYSRTSAGRQGQERAATYNEDNNWFWRGLFAAVSPRRFTIVASPRMLASLLSRMLFLGDAWSFQMPWHVLSVSLGAAESTPTAAMQDRPAEASAASSSQPTILPPDTVPGYQHKRMPCELFTIRPWTSLLLNEGSSLRVYRTHEFFLRRPPSILGALLGCEEFPNDVPLIPPSVRDLAYVGIFPLSSHFNTLVQHLPRVDRLFVQLVPRNGILNDREEMRDIDEGDLWMERNTSYSLLMRELLDGEPAWDLGEHVMSEDDEDLDEGQAELQGPGHDGGETEAAGLPKNNWHYLKEFESGDAADREAWDLAVEYVRLSGREWVVERDGVFVKRGPRRRRPAGDPAAAPLTPGDDDDDDDSTHSAEDAGYASSEHVAADGDAPWDGVGPHPILDI